MIEFDEIRKQVAIKHNVLIGKEDPILVTVTVNELVLGRYVELVADRCDDANKALTVSLQQQVEQSKQTAGKVITDAANYVSEQVRQAVSAALADAGNDVRRQITSAQAASREAVASGKDAQAAKTGAYLAAGLAGLAAVVALTALVVVLLK